jgi:methylmalonyl-CoA/ethylmalonyl-CoA epimerase
VAKLIIRTIEIGVAVKDIKQAGQNLKSIFNASSSRFLKAPNYNMTAQMFRMGNIEFELMEPMVQEGMIENFIRQRGEGLHHIAFEVDDILAILGSIKQRGFKVIDQEPLSAHGVKAAFLHPASFAGVLIELIEGNSRWVDDGPLPVALESPGFVEAAGVQGILAVGVLVENVSEALKIYSRAFAAESSDWLSFDFYSSEICVCRVGNVDLMLIEMSRSDEFFGRFLKAKRPGLHHVVLKVGDLNRSIEFLNNQGIDFDLGQFHQMDDSKFAVINPTELNGVAVLLKDKRFPESSILNLK